MNPGCMKVFWNLWWKWLAGDGRHHGALSLDGVGLRMETGWLFRLGPRGLQGCAKSAAKPMRTVPRTFSLLCDQQEQTAAWSPHQGAMR